MQRIIRVSALISTLIVGCAAHGAVISHGHVLDADGVPVSAVDGATVVDFNQGCGYTACAGNFAIVSGSVQGRYASPYIVDSASADATPYLTVPEIGISEVMYVDLWLGSVANYFGLLWGSIDSYNAISFWLGDALVGVWSGSEVIDAMANGAAANGHQTSGLTNLYVNFFDLGEFDRVRVASSNFGFESDNHAYAYLGGPALAGQTLATVPEPGTAGLLLLGLAGLALRRRQA